MLNSHSFAFLCFEDTFIEMRSSGVADLQTSIDYRGRSLDISLLFTPFFHIFLLISLYFPFPMASEAIIHSKAVTGKIGHDLRANDRLLPVPATQNES